MVRGLEMMKKSKAFTLFLVIAILLCRMTIVANAIGVEAVQSKGKNDERPNYALYVNTALNCVTVYECDRDGTETPIKAMVCSVGKPGHETPLGSFRTSDYYDWRLMVDNTYAQYAVRFNQKILFHSVPYLQKAPDTLEWDQYNLLGQSASLGCVRMCCADVKWIYDNCKVGTKVVVYSDGENPGPLGKPEIGRINEYDSRKNWDPTDIHPDNPWHNVETW